MLSSLHLRCFQLVTGLMADGMNFRLWVIQGSWDFDHWKSDFWGSQTSSGYPVCHRIKSLFWNLSTWTLILFFPGIPSIATPYWGNRGWEDETGCVWLNAFPKAGCHSTSMCFPMVWYWRFSPWVYQWSQHPFLLNLDGLNWLPWPEK